MAGESRSEGRFRISPVDRHGRTIDPAVLDAAEQIAQRAIQYAENIVRDPAVATNLLEESAAAVSRVLRRKQETRQVPVHNLHAYLFRAFIRRVNKKRRKDLAVVGPGSAFSGEWSASADPELKILFEEFIARCDPTTRDMLYRRIQGFSWKEIGKAYGISAHAAESRFSQALQRVRRKLGLRK